MRVGGRGRQRDTARNVRRRRNRKRRAASQRGSTRLREKRRITIISTTGAMKLRVQILQDRNAYLHEARRGKQSSG